MLCRNERAKALAQAELVSMAKALEKSAECQEHEEEPLTSSGLAGRTDGGGVPWHQGGAPGFRVALWAMRSRIGGSGLESHSNGSRVRFQPMPRGLASSTGVLA